MAVNFRRHDGNAVHLALDHSAHASAHAFRVVVRVGDDDLVTATDGGKLKALYQLREKRVDDIRDDQAEHLAAPGNQGSRLRIGIVAKLADGTLYLLRSSRPHEAALIDGPRNGGG